MANSSRKNSETVPSGMILLRKGPGVTSFDSLGAVKRALGSGKAGHTGTLDRFAEGLLVVLTGRALKLSQWFARCDKRYEGAIRFGAETDTLDPEGAVVAEAPPPSREAVEGALALFRGKIEQAPPAYSAIRVGGERASALARRGEPPEMRKRPVEIYRLELSSWEPPLAGISVHCSSGTYIRSLARDIALAAGSRAHLAALLRTRVAGFRLEDAACAGEGGALSPRPVDRGAFAALGLPCLEAGPDGAREIARGKPLREALGGALGAGPFAGASAAAVFHGDSLLAVVERSPAGGEWKYGHVHARGLPCA